MLPTLLMLGGQGSHNPLHEIHRDPGDAWLWILMDPKDLSSRHIPQPLAQGSLGPHHKDALHVPDSQESPEPTAWIERIWAPPRLQILPDSPSSITLPQPTCHLHPGFPC